MQLGVPACRNTLLSAPADAQLLDCDRIADAHTQHIQDVLASSLQLDDNSDHRDLYRHSTYTRKKGERRRTYAAYVWHTGTPSHKLRQLDRALAAFRLGSHDLQVLHRGNRTERHEMSCPHCQMDIIEDEFHLLLECPAHTAARQQFRHLFCHADIAPPHMPLCLRIDGDNTLRLVFDTPHQADLTRFIRLCIQNRKQSARPV